MRTPRRRPITFVAAVAGVAVVAVGLTLTVGEAGLSADGPVQVRGTTATATYPYAGELVREVRYVDAGRLSYTFTLTNDGMLPVTVTGLARTPGAGSSLLRPQALVPAYGDGGLTLWPGQRERVRLVVLMRGCEGVSSRAGSLLEAVRVTADVAGFAPRSFEVTLPERVHTGSPRDAHCPGSTTATRSPG